MIKPDSVQRGLVDEIISRLEKKGFTLAAPLLEVRISNGSDAVERAKKEIALWFPDSPVGWRSILHPWIYE